MEVEVKLPKLGTSMTTGIIEKWLKAVGDTVVQGDDLVEIMTDKVEAVVPSPASGTLVRIMIDGGDEVEVGTVLGVIQDHT